MLKDAPVMITYSVDDLSKAKQFYHDVLGLEVDDSMQGMLGLQIKNNVVMMYEKKNHMPAVYTLLNFTVANLEQTMSELKAKGVVFEQYDLPDCKTNAQGIVDYGVMKVAFFNDPAGNNHAINQMVS